MMAAAKDGGGAEEGEELLLAMAHLAMMVFNLAGLLGGLLNRYVRMPGAAVLPSGAKHAVLPRSCGFCARCPAPGFYPPAAL